MSRPKVTITLGRSGQVVKSAGNALNESRSSSSTFSGSKRSIRDRLGGNADNVVSGSQSNVKRQRVESKGSSYVMQDLRGKLAQKSKAKQINNMSITRHNNMILHGNVSTANPSTLTLRQHMHCPHQGSSLRRIPPTSSVDDLLQLNSRKSYPSWDGLRHGSPERMASASRELVQRYGSSDRRVGASRGHFPVKLLNGQPQVPAYRPAEVSGVSSYAGKDVYPHTQPVVTRTTLSAQAPRPITSQHLQSSIPQSSSYLIDMTVLRHMQDNDLKELGIPMGPRRKILLSLLSLSRRM